MFFSEGCICCIYTFLFDYSSAGSLVGFITLGVTAEVFELSHKKNILSLSVAIETV